MDKDKKITLSLFLTWLVFGLFNLFGQPQAFVPPIIVDGLMIVGLGFFFFLRSSEKNIFDYAILSFAVFILLIASGEIGWLEVNQTLKYSSGSIGVIFTFLLFIGSVILIKSNRFQAMLGILISILFFYSFITGIFDVTVPIKNLEFIIYCLGALASVIVLFIPGNKDPIYPSFVRITLLITLHFFFDIGNFLALLALAS